jgi:hypothetical protein
LTFPAESHFIPLFYEVYGDPANDTEAYSLASKILNLEWVREWELALDASQFSSYRSYAEIVSKIYQEWTRKENKHRWGDKTPQYVTEIPVLLKLFPDCKIIHIIRDGRDVALSWLHVNFGPENIFTAAKQWKYFVSSGRNFGSKLPPETYFEVSYEALINHPRDILERTCIFLNEPFSDEILRPSPLERGFRDPIFGTRKPKYASGTEIVKANLGKWRKKMSSFDRTIFESVAGDLLASLGYETEGAVRRITRAEQMFWRTHHSFWWLLARLDAGDKMKWIKTDFLFHWAAIRNRYEKFRSQ